MEFEHVVETVFLNPDHPKLNEASELFKRGIFTSAEIEQKVIGQGVEKLPPLFLTPDPKKPNVPPPGIEKKVSYYIEKPKPPAVNP